MNKEKSWVRVTECENIPLREGKAVEVAGHRIAIFNLGDSYLAIQDSCPHRGGPLSDGIVSGSTVVCPLHAWTFDLTSGSVVNHPESHACVATFPVRVEEGVLEVEISPRERDTEFEPTQCDHRDRPLRWIQRKTSSSAGTNSSLSDLS